MKKLLDSSLIIGAISLFGYLCAYCLEWGYLTFYEISATFVQVNIATFVLTALVFVLFYTFFNFADSLLAPFLLPLRNGGTIARSLFKAVFIWICITIFIVLAAYAQNKKIDIRILGAIGFVIFFGEFGIPMIFHPKTKGLARKIQATNKVDSEANKTSIIGYDPSTVILTVTAILVFAGLSFVGGRYLAKNTDIYAIIDKPNEQDTYSVVVRSYGENMLVAEVKNGHTTGKYSIAEVNGTTSFQNKKIKINR